MRRSRVQALARLDMCVLTFVDFESGEINGYLEEELLKIKIHEIGSLASCILDNNGVLRIEVVLLL